MVGSTVLYYRIIEELGVGERGTVFRAVDLKQDRNTIFVALKVLSAPTEDQSAKQHYQREVAAVAQLGHPNIAPVYSLEESEDGQLFICMPLFEGATLKKKLEMGKLPVKTSVDIATKTAQALENMHKGGICHHNLKPSNIIFSSPGKFKILDYCINRVGNQNMDVSNSQFPVKFNYLSPEQIEGKAFDHRSDIWSLGVVFYEMLTGRFPFAVKDNSTIANTIMREDFKSVASVNNRLPEQFQGFFEKALAKNPLHRYQNMIGLIDDLNKIVENKGAVLNSPPQRNNQNTPPQDLSFIKKEEPPPPIETGSEREDIVFREQPEEPRQPVLPEEPRPPALPVEPIQKNSAVPANMISEKESRRPVDELPGDNLPAISLEKTPTKEKTQSYNTALKAENSKRVQENAVLENNHHHAKFKTPAENEANADCIKGFSFMAKWTIEDLKTAKMHFENALEKHPQFEPAYAGLAQIYDSLGIYGAYSPKSVMPKAKENAVKALKIEENLPEALTALGTVKAVYDWDWENAEKYFKQGIMQNPNQATVHHWYAINYLTPRGYFKEAIEALKKARIFEPASLVLYTTLGLQYYYARQYDTAIKYYNKVLEINPDYGIANFFLAQAYTQKSMQNKALDQFHQTIKTSGKNMNVLAAFGNAAGIFGKTDVTLKVLDQLLEYSKQQYVPAYDIALVCLGLEDKDRAFEWLEEALIERSYMLIYLKVDPGLDRLRSDMRFQMLLEKTGLA